MPLQPAGATLTWDEPLFFKLRLSSGLGWIARGLAAIVVYGLFVVMIFAITRSPTAPPLGVVEVFLGPALVAVAFVVAFELPTVQRSVTLTDKDISYVGTLTKYGFGGMFSLLTGMGSWNRREIRSVRLLRPGEPGNQFPFRLMVIEPKYGKSKLIGVPLTVGLDDVANHLHSMGLVVELSGWQSVAEKTKAE
jgi:hypothetical protein